MFESQEEYDYAMQAEAEAEMAAQAAEGEAAAEQARIESLEAEAHESIGLSKLLACPFCGGQAHITLKSRGYRVECKNRWNLPECPMNMRTHHHDKKEDASLGKEGIS